MISFPSIARSYLSVGALATCAVFAPATEATIKCWTNADGVRECGNAVPPEYAQDPHEELNEQGITVDRVDAAISKEELDAQRRAQREAERAERERAKQREHDRVLLDTYTSVTDLELAREGQVSHIESQIRITEDRIEKLQKNLDQKISKAAEIERQGRTPPPNLRSEIVNLESQIEESQSFIKSKKRERELVEAQFLKDIDRYRELKGIPVADEGGADD